LKFNPLNPEKLEALKSSISETGFWSNVIVRPHPEKQGKYQLSYGHHRLQSAIDTGLTEAEFVVRDLDENMLLKMMELENSESYRYCPLSLLESVKAVVNALAAGRIAPFHATECTDEKKGVQKHRDKFKSSITIAGVQKHLGIFDTEEEAAQAYREAAKGILRPAGGEPFRLAPGFVPSSEADASKVYASPERAYRAADISKYLGRNTPSGQTSLTVRAALDALYLLEVKAITTASIKDMNWSQLGKFVADAKALRERTILRTVKTKDEINKLNAEALRVQTEHKERERKAEEERKALVKKLAEAKREEDEKEKKKVQVKLEVLEDKVEEDEEVYKEKRKKIDDKVEQVKRVAEETKKEDLYLPVRKETDRIVHLLERRDEEEQIKALARKPLNPNDRERLRQAALTKGAWYTETVARWLVPPRNAKEDLVESAKREEANRRAESKGEQC
jgi:hypothetical protein